MPEFGKLEERCAAYKLLGLAVWVFDIDNRRVAWANPAALQVWRSDSLEELAARDMGVDMSDGVARRLEQYKVDFLDRDADFHEQWTLYPAGVPVPLSVRFSSIRLDDGRIAMLCEGTPSDSMTPVSLRSVEALLHTAVMVTLYDTAGNAVYRNPAARAAAVSTQRQLSHHFANPQDYDLFQATLAAQGIASATVKVATALGARWHELSARRCTDAVTGNEAVLVSESDVSAIKDTEEHAQFLSQHDLLTGLPNRSHVLLEFERAIAAMQGTRAEAALVFIDLDHFKDVNDTMGHAAGDELLVAIANRLRQATRATDLVARLGGDEFVLLITGSDVRAELERVKQRLLRKLTEPVNIQGTEVSVTPSAGVAWFPQDGVDVETLMRNADLAMYSAKESGRNNMSCYTRTMSETLQARTALESELRHALQSHEFEVYYQPMVKGDGSIYGAEALVRWNHSQRGLITPYHFIPVCESIGLIRQLGTWVLEEAARQQVRWTAMGHALRISVNLSAHQLAHPEFLDDVQRAMRTSCGVASHMELEITESVLVNVDDSVIERLHTLVRQGFKIALDDFGTGYSNLAYLQHLPFHSLKIDRSFVQANAGNRPLAAAIVSMCRIMGFVPVAEGVETQEQQQWINALGVDHQQGYFFGKPMPAAEFEAILRNTSPTGHQP